MQPLDTAALEAAAWSEFVEQLGTALAAHWPTLPTQLGERYATFVQLAVDQALARGLRGAAAVARYVNLCVVWGPGFHDRPGFEWARALLAAPAKDDWSLTHRLMRGSDQALRQMEHARIDPAALERSDADLCGRFGHLGRQGELHPPEPRPLPRAACDLEAVELRLLDDSGPGRAYRLDAEGDWQFDELPAPAPLRVRGPEWPMPERLSLLVHEPPGATPTRLQTRVRAHAQCDPDTHPAVRVLGPHGIWRWAGHATRAVDWPLACRPQPSAGRAAAGLLAEETEAEYQRLHLDACGLRDEGDPQGPLQTDLAIRPAAQWWQQWQRSAPAEQTLLPGGPRWQAGSTRCRLECDGQAREALAMQRRFEQSLDAILADGMDKLLMSWAAVPDLASPGIEGRIGLLIGEAASTWGWHLAAPSLGSPVLMRLVSRITAQACQADLVLRGEWSLMGTRSRLALRLSGDCALQAILSHEAGAPPLHDSVPATLQARWRFPITLSHEPLATAEGTLLQLDGPPSGALIGEAGLRPCASGCGGWTWFARLAVEEVTVPLRVTDPLLGERHHLAILLPAQTLADWSLV